MENRQYVVAYTWPHNERVWFYRDKIIGLMKESRYEEYLLEGGYRIRIDTNMPCDIINGEF